MIGQIVFELIELLISKKFINSKELEKKLQQQKEEISQLKQHIEYKEGEMYVVNVCALYIASNRKILLTGSESKLISDVKGFKYRPIVITRVIPPHIYMFALSINKDYKHLGKTINFDSSNCKFITKNCFIPKIERNSYIFERKILRKRKGKIESKIEKEFSLSISVLRNLKFLEDSPYKKETIKICEIHENYKLLKKCANCNKDYIKQILYKIHKR